MSTAYVHEFHVRCHEFRARNDLCCVVVCCGGAWFDYVVGCGRCGGLWWVVICLLNGLRCVVVGWDGL